MAQAAGLGIVLDGDDQLGLGVNQVGAVDCDDSDCTGDPACDVPVCGVKNAACSINEDCRLYAAW